MELVRRLQQHSAAFIRATAFAAELDCLLALAGSARDFQLARPVLTPENVLHIKDGEPCRRTGAQFWLVAAEWCGGVHLLAAASPEPAGEPARLFWWWAAAKQAACVRRQAPAGGAGRGGLHPKQRRDGGPGGACAGAGAGLSPGRPRPELSLLCAAHPCTQRRSLPGPTCRARAATSRRWASSSSWRTWAPSCQPRQLWWA